MEKKMPYEKSMRHKMAQEITELKEKTARELLQEYHNMSPDNQVMVRSMINVKMLELMAKIEELEEEKDYWYNMYMSAHNGFEVNDL